MKIRDSVLENPYHPKLKPAVSSAALIGASLGSAAISGGASYATSAANAKWTYNQMDTQHQYEIENMIRQQQFQRMMYERTLKDSSPAEQRRLYEEAGYNPYLIDDSGLGNAQGQLGASAAPSTSASPSAGPYNFDWIGQFGSGLSGVLQRQAEIDNLNADTENKKLEGLGQQIELKYKEDMIIQGMEEQKENIRYLLTRQDVDKATKENLQKQSDKLEQDIYYLKQTADGRIDAVSLQNQQIKAATAYQQAQTSTENLLRDEKLRNLIASTGNLKAQSASLYAGLAEISQRIALMGSQIDFNSKQGQLVAAQEAKTLAEKLGVENNNRNYPLLVRKLEAEIKRLNVRRFGEYDPSAPMPFVKAPIDNDPLDDGRTSSW